MLLLEGLAGIIAAAITVLWPAITTFAVICVIAAWAVVTGVFQIVAAVRLRKVITGEWLLALSGVASVAFGVMLMMRPITGALVIALWVGAYALISGVLVALGLCLRSWMKLPDTGSRVPLPAR